MLNFLASIFCDLSTVYARDATNQMKIKNAKKLLKTALNLVKNEENESSSLIQISIFQNLAAVNNQLRNFKRSIQNTKTAYELIPLNSLNQSIFSFCSFYSLFCCRMILNLKDYHFLSDLKYNEGYAQAKLKNYEDAIFEFTQSHKFAKNSKYIFIKNMFFFYNETKKN